MESKALYRTRDIFVAAWLHSNGEPVELEPSANESSKFWFVFNESPAVRGLVDDFARGVGLVSPLSLKNSVDYLKDMMEGSKRNG